MMNIIMIVFFRHLHMIVGCWKGIFCDMIKLAGKEDVLLSWLDKEST